MNNDKLPRVDIYTDGACSGNPGPGGYGVVLLYNGVEKELSGTCLDTTNNRMEMLAAIKALEALKKPCDVVLYSDSRYLVDGINKGWVEKWRRNGWMRGKNKEAKNVDLWKRLLNIASRHQIKWVWVRGHCDNKYNNRCDRLATDAIKEI
ncbi:MAG TPA: ribonuclease HI [Clostridia bacterium]|nr:ribonuclease HI [Clostridia bacterium]